MEVDAVVTVSSRMASVADIPQHKMNIASNPGDASSELWAFSLVFYQQPDVMSALLALQDGAGLDVNLILFALWLGLSGRGRVDDRAVDAADRSVRVLRAEVIEPLRALRRRSQVRRRCRYSALARGDQGARDRCRKSSAGPARRTRRACVQDQSRRVAGRRRGQSGLVLRSTDGGSTRRHHPPRAEPPCREAAPPRSPGSPQRLTVPLSSPNRSSTRPKV